MIKLIIDSTSDYETKEIEEKGMILVPLTVVFKEESFKDGVDITKDEFYKKLEKENPTSSQPSPQQFEEVFNKIKKNKDEAIVITIGLGLSGTYQSAMLAKNMVDYDKIYVINSKMATAATRVLIEYAYKLIKEGKTGKEINDLVLDLIPRVELRISPSTLEYLYRGGRLSKGSMRAANLLKIKPVLMLEHEQGKVESPYKGLGVNGAISKIVKEMTETDIDLDFKFVYGYTTGLDNLNLLIEKVKQKYNNDYEVVQSGAIIGTHLGPGGYMIAYVRKA